MATAKTTFVTKDKLEEIAAEFPTPFHLYDEAGIRENARRVVKAFAWNKTADCDGFKEFFAVKATPNYKIMKLLLEEGCGFDCASDTELTLAAKVLRDTGTPAFGNIMFSGNVTPDHEFRVAKDVDAIINLDDVSFISAMENVIGVPDTVSLRYNPGGVFETPDRQIMDTPAEAKYGLTHEQLLYGYRLLKEKGAANFGIHAFLSSNTKTNDYYPTLARLLFNTAIEIREKTDVSLSFINLSGGIGIPYHPSDTANDIAVIGAGVRKAYEEVLVPAGFGGLRIFSELGRFMLAPYGCLVTRAIREKHTYRDYIGVDASACDLMRPAMYGAYHHITVAGKEAAPAAHTYDVTGGLCENNDKFAVARELPQISTGTDGDLLIIHDTGAHGHSMGYNYNGRLRHAELLLREDGTVELIRRAETPEDYFRTLVY